MKVFGYIILAIIAFAISVPSASEPDDTGEIGSWLTCRDKVKEVLIAPSTADFPRLIDVKVTEIAKNRFRVEAYVDAQNAFGAKLRKNFVCEVEYEGNYRFRITSLSGLD